MSIYSNVTEEDLNNLRKLADLQKTQRALNFKNRILKQTHDIKLAESFSPISKKLDTIKKSTKQLGETVKKSNVEDGHSQTPAIENTTTSQSLRDTLSFMRTSENFIKLEQRDRGEVFWNGVFIKPYGENRVRVNDQEHDITPDVQAYFTNTKFTTKFLDNIEKETVSEIDKNVRFHENIPKIGFNSARMKIALYNLPKEIAKIRNPPLPTIEIVEDSSDLEGKRGKKNVIPSNIIDIYTTLQIFLGLKISGHTDTLTEASNLIDDLYKRGEIQNEQQYRNALNEFSSR